MYNVQCTSIKLSTFVINHSSLLSGKSTIFDTIQLLACQGHELADTPFNTIHTSKQNQKHIRMKLKSWS
jgi:hypothetical protein